MARSRHGRSRGEPSPAGSGLPSWAQRHLDEANDPPPTPETSSAAFTSHRRSSAGEPNRLRGWGVAIVSVAAAVGVVPLAITSLANDPSNDPLPKVDTYTAGAPAPLENGAGGTAGGRAGTAPLAPGPAGTDPASTGVLTVPPVAAPPAAAPPVAAAPIVPERAVPAAVVRATPTVTPTTTTKTSTPRSASPTTTESTEQSRSATKPAPTRTSSSSKPGAKPHAPASKEPAAPSTKQQGLVPSVLHAGTSAVDGVADTAGDVLGGL